MRYLMDPMGIIPALVEALLPRHSPEDKVLVVNLELKMENQHNWKFQKRQIHLIFHRPGNYTKVLWLIGDWSGNPPSHSPLKFRLRSNHDSCWRNDGVDAPLYELAQELERMIPGTEMSIVRELEFDAMSPFALMSVRSLEQDHEDEWSYLIEFV